MKRTPLVIIAVLLIVIGSLTPLITTAVTFLLPEAFASTATIALPVTDPSMVAAEINMIQSRPVLDRVAASLDLSREWAAKFRRQDDLPADAVHQLLRGSLLVRQIRNTGLIRIQVYGDNAEEVAVIANKIVDVYRVGSQSKDFVGNSAVQIIEPAKPNLRPVRPNKRLNILLGLFFGAGLAVIGITLLASRRTAKQ